MAFTGSLGNILLESCCRVRSCGLIVSGYTLYKFKSMIVSDFTNA